MGHFCLSVGSGLKNKKPSVLRPSKVAAPAGVFPRRRSKVLKGWVGREGPLPKHLHVWSFRRRLWHTEVPPAPGSCPPWAATLCLDPFAMEPIGLQEALPAKKP